MPVIKRKRTEDSGEAIPIAKKTSTESMKFTTFFKSEAEFTTFYSKSANACARSLSNFSPYSVYINFDTIFPGLHEMCIYPTGEHAFHGGKFKILGSILGSAGARQDELFAHSRLFEGENLNSCHYSTPAAAKKAGGKGGIRLSDAELANWDYYSMVVQEQICREKSKVSEIQQFLFSTGDKYLVHNERTTTWPRYGATILKPENSPFGDDHRWMKGDNLLGELWMKLRNEVKDS